MKNLIQTIRKFNLERDWEQFHSPKNLAMALSVEVGEIVEQLQWLTQEQSWKLEPEKLVKIREEIADVMIYLVNLALRTQRNIQSKKLKAARPSIRSLRIRGKEDGLILNIK
jgi:NTP pyrophosphatase (non-canonical NTP hydrolase)